VSLLGRRAVDVAVALRASAADDPQLGRRLAPAGVFLADPVPVHRPAHENRAPTA